MTENKIAKIADDFSWGSPGFCREVEATAGLDISRNEIERIADAAATRVSAGDDDAFAKKFMQIWDGEDFWSDENN